ncbi:hypothetical protein MXD61_14335 [Frankia sp. AgPm24]|uniref:hypothetical protein n=1 Tax=Frankia sp. AgPm24 TaxID=631128 RepID=UPI00200ECEF6|nr:hypothetical protein [Frankia sp. AgPm24]MCK9923034.1 hypothetical protein [Frankia sp. AgPm24]
MPARTLGRLLAGLFTVLSASTVAVVAITTPAVAVAAADPTPLGPQRPVEPDVEGPENLDTLTSSATRNGVRGGLNVTFDRTSRTADGGVPAGARRFVFLLDKSLTVNPSAFPVCTRQTVDTAGVSACPPASVVGSAVGTYLNGNRVQATAVNSRVADRPGILLVFPATGQVLEQTLEPVTGAYRQNYRWAIDELLMPNATPPQDRPGTVRFTATFGATTTVAGRPVSYLQTSDPDGPYRFALWSEFVTGQVAVPTDCTVPTDAPTPTPAPAGA